MANDFKNTSLVTRFAVKEFLNAMQLAGKVDRQLDESFTRKVGETVNVRRPVMFTAVDGATLGAAEDIEEGIVPVTLDQRKHVHFNITTQDETLKIEDANERYIKPAMIELAQVVESSLAATYTEIPNFVGTPGTTPGTFLDVANAKAALNRIGVPMDTMRSAFYDPDATIQLSNGLKGVFPEKMARTALEEAMIGRYAGFDLYENQSLKTHTVGNYGGTPLVNGASQNVTYATAKDTDTQTLVTDGWTTSVTGLLKAGDVITIAGVNSVNQRTREDTGQLQQFVVTSDVDSDGSGNATLTIAPPIITSGPYQTVTAAPADNAAISVVSGSANAQHRQNLAFHKNAITLAFAQLDTPRDGATSFRQNFKNVSIRTTRQYDINNDRTVFRFDILYGIKVQNRRFAVRTTN